MKKTLIFLILISACTIYAQTDDKENLKLLNDKIKTAFQNNKLDDALKLTEQALALSIKIYGANHTETAIVYTNIGIIYREKRKFKDSVQNFQNSLTIYKQDAAKYKNNIARLYENLSGVQFLSGDKKAAEESALDSFKIREEIYGKESKDAYLSNLMLAELYARIGKAGLADEHYLKSYTLAIKHFGKSAAEVEQIDDSRACANLKWGEDDKVFLEAKRNLFGYDLGNVINGKAKSLGKPPYPREARAAGADGTVVIKILIDEEGNPTEPKAMCGHPLLRPTSEEAARRSKFEPTIINGKPSKIRGYIIYKYVR